MTTNSFPALRIADADRERTVTALRRAVGEGRLTLAEGDERMATAYAARTAAALAPLLADLPADLHPDRLPLNRTHAVHCAATWLSSSSWPHC